MLTAPEVSAKTQQFAADIRYIESSVKEVVEAWEKAKRSITDHPSITNERSPEAVDYHIRNLHKFYLKQHYEYDLAYLGDEAKSLNDDVYRTKNLLDLFKRYQKCEVSG